MPTPANHRPAALAPDARLGLWVLVGALVVVGAPLVLVPARTETLFSWTIEPPLTAAWLGACYWGSALLVVLTLRQRAWSHVRVAVPGIFVAGAFLLASTFIHIDRFHMDSVTGWIWVTLYSLLPFGAIGLIVRQRAMPAGDPPRAAPMPRWAVVGLAVQAVVLIATGAALVAVPEETASAWPWTLTPLTSRAIGAWLLALGASAAQAAREADWDRNRAGMAGYGAIAALWVLALVRFAGTPDETDPSTWILVAAVVTVLLTGVGAATAGRAPRSGSVEQDVGAAVGR